MRRKNYYGILLALAAAFCLALVLFVNAQASEAIAIDELAFPDDTFRSFVSVNYDTNDDGFLSQEELDSVCSISVSNMGVESLKGVELFAFLEELSCESNELEEIDVHYNTNLQHLDCRNNLLSHLDVSSNEHLKKLYCSDNLISDLDISANAELVELWCYGNHMNELLLGKNTNLTFIDCSNNDLSILDVTGLSNLQELYCGYNRLKEIDLRHNRRLDHIGCGGNQLSELDISNNNALRSLYCENNAIEELDISKCSYLSQIDCYYNHIHYLDISNANGLMLAYKAKRTTNGDIFSFIKNYNRLQVDTFTKIDEGEGITGVSIDEENFPDPVFRKYLLKNCDTVGSGEMLSEAELNDVYSIVLYGSGEKAVRSLQGISFFPNLAQLDCVDQELTELDISENKKLTSLNCYGNHLTELNLSNNKKLTKVVCSNNELTELDLSNNRYLTLLECDNNKLTELMISNCPQLTLLNGNNKREPKNPVISRVSELRSPALITK